jgi:hypothetical protein
VEIPVASLPTLLGTKLHALRYNAANRGSKNDLQDILELARANQIDVTNEWFKTLCEKYGTVELWTEIQKRCRAGREIGQAKAWTPTGWCSRFSVSVSGA